MLMLLVYGAWPASCAVDCGLEAPIADGVACWVACHHLRCFAMHAKAYMQPQPACSLQLISVPTDLSHRRPVT